MSILLEALKKSEAQRQLGATPTLNTPIDEQPLAGRTPRDWVPAALMILTAAAIAWIGWAQFRAPVADKVVAGDPVAQPVPGATAADTGAGRPAEPLAADGASGPGASVPVGPERKSTGDDVEEKRRLLGQSFRSYSSSAQEEEGEAAPAPAGRRAVAVAPQEAERVEPAGDPVAGSAASAEQPARAGPPAEETMSYWQIPKSLREQMPEMRIRVLVYAERPEDRFLLVNDQRLREGDELESGLRLEAIQRDRAIFSYRNYRFHLKG